MKSMIVAALAVLSLGVGTAFAQGLPAGSTPPVYGAYAFPNEPYHNGTVFSEIYHGVFGHDKSDTAVANKTADQKARANGS